MNCFDWPVSTPKNLQRFLELAGDDASISIDMLNSWEAKLKHALDIQEVRYRYASLFSQMATERAGDSTLPRCVYPNFRHEHERGRARRAFRDAGSA